MPESATPSLPDHPTNSDALHSALHQQRFPSRPTTPADLPALEALHDQVFGPGALTRTAYRIREGQPHVSPFCRVLHHDGVLVAAIRYTVITIGADQPALMLGPLAVAAAFANQGHGRRLIAESLDSARAAQIELVLLIGDAPYYQRFGFIPVARGRIQFPGPVDPARILAAEFTPGSTSRASGMVRAATQSHL